MKNAHAYYRLGDSSAIAAHHASQITAEKERDKPALNISLHPNSRAEYSAIVKGIRDYHKEFDLTLFETASVKTYEDHPTRTWFGTTEFYFNAKDAAQNHGRVEICIFWP